MDIGHDPMFGDFAILHPHRIQRFEVDFLACWRHTKKATVMGAVVSLNLYLSCGELRRRKMRDANARVCVLVEPYLRYDVKSDYRHCGGRLLDAEDTLH
jgi:hypothetical protein